MPELPEVETMVRGIRPHVEGRTIERCELVRCRCRPISVVPPMSRISRQVEGQEITAVRRRAKRIVLELMSGAGFVIEPRMTGLMLLADPPDESHLRVCWTLSPLRGEVCTQLWFWDRRGLGTVRLMTADELALLWSDTHLGPDALEMTPARWREVCQRTHRPIKLLLLDQSRVAGIGNLYASEILHLSRIDPHTPASQLTRAQVGRLHAATDSILHDAIRHEGSTLSDGTYRNVLNQNGSYQNAHRVYDRAGEYCPTCARGTIVRIVQGQRSTFYCPRCQRMPG